MNIAPHSVNMIRKYFSERFADLQVLGVGFSGAVFRARDNKCQKPCILKVFFGGDPAILQEYTDHLLHIQSALKGVSLSNLVLPYDAGRIAGIFFQTFDPILANPLSDLAKTQGALEPAVALDILEKIAHALRTLHGLHFVHGDISPHNILVTSDSERRVYLIDFGMLAPYGEGDALLYVGTYRYMHPDLKGILQDDDLPEGRIRLRLRARVGPYIDIYAAGVVALQMLAGETDAPHPLSEEGLAFLLTSRNPHLRRMGPVLLGKVVSLLFEMLSIRSPNSGISALDIASICATLKLEIAQTRDHAPSAAEDVMASQHGATPFPPHVEQRAVAEALVSLEAITRSLSNSSAAMLRTAERLVAVSSAGNDAVVLGEMNLVFSNALRRVRVSWGLAMAMTGASFVAILAMIVCAVVFAFVKGESGWGLVFGGASVPLIIGTLLWRPYDRAFRATIISQQLEMIHVQATSAFKGTVDFEKRIEVCREAMQSLRTLLQEHAADGKPPAETPEGGRRGTRRKT